MSHIDSSEFDITDTEIRNLLFYAPTVTKCIDSIHKLY